MIERKILNPNLILICILIITGMTQMIIARLLGLHNGLDHMIFNYWWEYILEGLFYSFAHGLFYYWLKFSQ